MKHPFLPEFILIGISTLALITSIFLYTPTKSHTETQDALNEEDGYFERQVKRNLIRKATGVDISPFEPDPLKHIFP